MRTILLGECLPENSYDMADPDARTEAEFEYAVARALTCVYSNYECIVFGGGFRYDNEVYRPDLALISRNRSHWFVVEVELVTHSLERHVLPQVRAFQYGTPEPDCIGILASQLRLERSQAQTMLDYIPRSVAVIANRRVERWGVALEALQVQMLTVSMFRTVGGAQALEVDGNLEVVAQSLGFGTYSATDRSLRFPRSVDIPVGKIQINDPLGAASLWTVSSLGDTKWITKDIGSPDMEHGTTVQFIRTVDGKLSMRRPR